MQYYNGPDLTVKTCQQSTIHEAVNIDKLRIPSLLGFHLSPLSFICKVVCFPLVFTIKIHQLFF